MGMFFKENELSKLKNAIDAYCKKQGYSGINLSDNEIAQLSYYLAGNTVTPEINEENPKDKLHFEIKRSIARLVSFQFLLEGDDKSYQAFIRSQLKIIPLGENLLNEKDELNDLKINESILSKEKFKKYSNDLKSMSKDKLELIRISCLLTISDGVKRLLKDKKIPYSEDSEVFLSQVPDIISQNSLEETGLFPIIKNFNDDQIKLIRKMYWPNLHLRHLMFVEGGKNMITSLHDGLENGSFTKDDFQLWKFRWLINLAGFKDTEPGKYLTEEIATLFNMLINDLEKVFDHPEYSVVENYLKNRAETAGIFVDKKISAADQKLLGSITANFNEITILNPDLGKAIIEGYSLFSQTENSLAKKYENKFNNPKAATYTYVPAVLNNTYRIFIDQYKLSEQEAIKQATYFMCQFLDQLLDYPQENSLSCMNIAHVKTLTPLVKNWYDNKALFKLSLKEGSFLEMNPLNPLPPTFTKT